MCIWRFVSIENFQKNDRGMLTDLDILLEKISLGILLSGEGGCSDYLKNVEELCIRACFSWLFFVSVFSLQDQLPQTIIAMIRVILHFQVHSVVIRWTLKFFQIFLPLSRKTGLNFLIFRLILSYYSERACLFIPN